MAKTRCQFTPEEKHSILQEAERPGVSETARKYKLAHGVLSSWKKKYLNNGKEDLKRNYKKVDPDLPALEDENARQQKLVIRDVQHFDVLGDSPRDDQLLGGFYLWSD
jgi:transposase-like protein